MDVPTAREDILTLTLLWRLLAPETAVYYILFASLAYNILQYRMLQEQAEVLCTKDTLTLALTPTLTLIGGHLHQRSQFLK